MNNFKFEYIEETDTYSINGELWRRAEPTAVEEVKKPYFPKPKRGDFYYYIGLQGGVGRYLWDESKVDNHFYHTLNCWLNKSEAEAYVARYGKYLPDRLTLAIRRWKIEHGVEDRFEWGFHSKDKYYTVYHFETKAWEVMTNSYMYEPLREYFSTKDTVRQCLCDLQEYFDNAIEMAIQLNEWNAMNGGTKSEGE